MVSEKYFSLMSQSEDICPADRRLYALRDVTATVDSLPLICGSIMSKKLAENLTGLVLDVKFGSGAFMKNLEQAKALAQLLKITGEKNGVEVIALLTDMNQPLGKFIGNALEVKECYEILRGQTAISDGVDYYRPTLELSVALSAYMFLLARKVKTIDDGYNFARELISSRKAQKCFEDLLLYQGPCSYDDLKISKQVYSFKSNSNGFIKSINAEALGLASIELHAGRKRTDDLIDHSTGIEMCCQINMKVSENSTLLKIYYSNDDELKNSLKIIEHAFEIVDHVTNENLPLIAQVLT